MKRISGRIIASVFLIVVSPFAAHALECGDLTADCEVSATDALALLRRAVGLNQNLFCDCDCESICQTNAVDPGIDCFGDEACMNADPSKPYCNGHSCSECSQDDHCGDGRFCDHALNRCMNLCATE